MRPLRLAEAWRAGKVAAALAEPAAHAAGASAGRNAGICVETAVPPARGGNSGAKRAAESAFDMPPEEDEFQEWQEMSEMPEPQPEEHIAGGAEEPEDEDVFEHGGDMGEAAYLPVTPQEDTGPAPDKRPAVEQAAPAEPVSKRPCSRTAVEAARQRSCRRHRPCVAWRN